MRVEIQLGGAGKASSGIRRLAQDLKALNVAQRSLARPTRTSTTQPGADDGGAESQPLKIKQGAYQRLASAQSSFADALDQGTEDQIRDASEELFRAQEALKKLQTRHVAPAPKLNFSGPAQRLQQAQRNLSLALQQGTQEQVTDAEIAVRKLSEQLTRAQRPALRSSLGGRLASLLFSTRINIPGVGGAGVSPLLGRLVTAVGATGNTALALGGVAIAATLGVAALKAFAEQVREGARSLGEVATARTLSGGTAGEVAAIGSFGVPTGEIASLAASVREARASNPFAAAEFGFQMPRPFGQVDEAKGLREVLGKLAGFDSNGKRLVGSLDTLNTELKRLRAARLIGLEGVLPLIEAMRRFPRETEADFAAAQTIQTVNATRNAANFAYAQQRAQRNAGLAQQAAAKPLLPDMTRVTNWLADVERRAALVTNRHPGITRNAGFAATSFFGGLGIFAGIKGRQLDPNATKAQKATADTAMFLLKSSGGLAGFLAAAADFLGGGKTPGKLGGGATPSAQVTDPSVQASRDLDATMRKLTDAIVRGGTYGGGDRARGTIPKHFMPAAADAKANWGSLHLGFWNL